MNESGMFLHINLVSCNFVKLLVLIVGGADGVRVCVSVFLKILHNMIKSPVNKLLFYYIFALLHCLELLV